ncbi:sulfite exporter TauE/SafE family protein [Campylobacterota bacterium DY0563]
MTFELILFGLTAGFVSGFFGLGGGTVLTPILVIAGFAMKEAIAISIMQMVFSSIYGSFLNSKKAKHIFKDGIILGIGGSLGGLLNSFVHSLVSDIFLQYVFIIIIIFSIIKIFVSPAEHNQEVKHHSKLVLILVGFVVGVIAMSIGVGGAIMLIPILVSFMKYPLKSATSLSLFFVIFSSLAGFTSLTITGQMPFHEGLIIGLASLVGVFFGIKTKNTTGAKNYKKSILVMNLIILCTMVYKTIL